MTHLSLFTGIGGLDLAAEAAGFTTVGQCEWADFPTKVLEKHWPHVPRWRDIRELTGESFYERTGLRTVDIISGGFPCQPFSTAGKRGGKEDDRYLWPDMRRIIEELRPTWVCGENVPGIIRMALDDVLSELEALGYTTQTLVIPACAVEAPHERQRCAIIAYSDRHAGGPRRPEPEGQQRTPWPSDGGNDVAHADSDRESQSARYQPESRTGTIDGGKNVAHAHGPRSQRLQQHGAPEPGERQQEPPGPAGERREALAHAHGPELQGSLDHSHPAGSAGPPDGGPLSDAHHRSGTVRRDRELQPAESAGGSRRDHAGGTPEHGSRERRTAEPGLGRSPDGLSAWMDGVRAGWRDGSWEHGIPRIATGVPNRVNRLKALGNAVVPAQFYPIFKAIYDTYGKEANQ